MEKVKEKLIEQAVKECTNQEDLINFIKTLLKNEHNNAIEDSLKAVYKHKPSYRNLDPLTEAYIKEIELLIKK